MPWENVFNVGVSAANTEFSEWNQVRIDFLCIPLPKNQAKPCFSSCLEPSSNWCVYPSSNEPG